jgi:hypothetical protein
MKSKLPLFSVALLIFVGITWVSCKKDHPPKKQSSEKYSWITGDWKQKDLVISVTVKLGGQTIPAGTSMIALAPLLGQALGDPAIADALLCTKDNTYSFHADSTYTINGCTDLILPKAGNNGTWKLTVYDAVLQLTSAKGDADPHWINDISENMLHLALTVHIPGVGDAPLGLILEKQ